MALDPTITTGNIITVVAILGGWFAFTTKKSFDLGEFKIQFDNLSNDVREIKKYIDEQHKEELVRLKADGASGTTMQLMQYRIDLHEREMQRMRANLHKVAQVVQVRLLSMEEVDNAEHGNR